ncbi:MAG: HupE/UreJ family protein [Pseudomonadota bacterium]
MFMISAPLSADDLRPLYVEIRELAQGEAGGTAFSYRVRLPPRIAIQNTPELQFPTSCTSEGFAAGFQVACTDSVYGGELTVVYPLFEVANPTVIKVILQSGEEVTRAYGSGERSINVPSPETAGGVAFQYTWLGMEHIWIGYDHLLFLLCLIWIAGDWRRILITITGFTLAHSVTLVLAALELVRLPVAPVEAVIALSVLFLARELALGPSDSLTWRHPIAVSSSFGLLHGLGFAAVLSEIGLPQLQLVTGLVAFNIGVEIGQVIFAFGVILLLRLFSELGRRNTALPVQGHVAAGYLVGTISAYWLIDRVVAF